MMETTRRNENTASYLPHNRLQSESEVHIVGPDEQMRLFQKLKIFQEYNFNKTIERNVAILKRLRYCWT